MITQQETERQQYVMVGRPPTGKPRKTKNIKVTQDVHEQLGQIGHTTEDFGDVCDRLIREHYELEKIKQSCVSNGLRPTVPTEDFGDVTYRLVIDYLKFKTLKEWCTAQGLELPKDCV
jgi:hypothetical protein